MSPRPRRSPRTGAALVLSTAALAALTVRAVATGDGPLFESTCLALALAYTAHWWAAPLAARSADPEAARSRLQCRLTLAVAGIAAAVAGIAAWTATSTLGAVGHLAAGAVALLCVWRFLPAALSHLDETETS